MEDFSTDYVKFRKLEKATRNFLEVAGNYDSQLMFKLNDLTTVAVDRSGSVVMLGCGEALVDALNDTGLEMVERTSKLQIAAQAVINAISKYDDMNDYHDVNFDPNERGANHNKAVRVNELESALDEYSIRTSKRKRVRLGIVEALKQAVL